MMSGFDWSAVLSYGGITKIIVYYCFMHNSHDQRVYIVQFAHACIVNLLDLSLNNA